MTCAPSEDSRQPVHPPVWSESWLCAHWVAKDPSFLHRTARYPSWSESTLGAKIILFVLSCGGSLMLNTPTVEYTVWKWYQQYHTLGCWLMTALSDPPGNLLHCYHPCWSSMSHGMRSTNSQQLRGGDSILWRKKLFLKWINCAYSA